jgi:hypothetical protein
VLSIVVVTVLTASSAELACLVRLGRHLHPLQGVGGDAAGLPAGQRRGRRPEPAPHVGAPVNVPSPSTASATAPQHHHHLSSVPKPLATRRRVSHARVQATRSHGTCALELASQQPQRLLRSRCSPPVQAGRLAACQQSMLRRRRRGSGFHAACLPAPRVSGRFRECRRRGDLAPAALARRAAGRRAPTPIGARAARPFLHASRSCSNTCTSRHSIAL